MKSANLPAASSIITSALFPYQYKWVTDQSRFKIALWARQTGKDYSATAEAVMDCLSQPNAEWLIVAAGERQALESLEKAHAWSDKCMASCHVYHGYEAARETLRNSTAIQWNNGSRIRALPAKPETLRGYSANLILTEFAFHEDAHALWRAIYPAISNPLQGGPKKLRIITTPNGRGNLFYDLWHNGEDYSRHRVTIHEAVAAGLPLDIPQLRAGLGDPEAWAQEYECEFLDTASVLLPYELLAQCESHEATTEIDSFPEENLFLGIDFGRKHDLTVCWALERVGELLWTREVLTMANTPTPAQLEALTSRVDQARLVCVDYTGPGIGLGDFLVQRFGQADAAGYGGKVQLCTFTQHLKAELFSRLRTAFEQRALRIPPARDIREDLHSILKIVSSCGGLTYRAADSPDGHADRATALALALHAASQTAHQGASKRSPSRAQCVPIRRPDASQG
ncbi:MAG TPA: terminase family protein [Methylomirabilota bacterium]|nr:terminase family protein [Methylomirabilota bacterium]